MLIINKYTIAVPNAIAAANGAALADGITGDRWGGINPDAATGATGNATAADGIAYVSASTTTIEDEVISKLVQIKFTGTFLVGAVPHYIKVPLINVGITGAKVVKAISLLGVFDPNATNTGGTPTPSVIDTTPITTISLSIIKDAIVVKVPDANRALVLNKYLNVLLIYSNY